MIHRSLPVPRFWPASISVAVAGLLCCATPIQADESDTQQWTLFTFQKELSPRWRGYFEVQPRFGSDVTNVEKLIVRPALGYRLNRKLSVWQGYGWVPTFSPGFLDEHRIFQQLLYEDRVRDTAIVNRFRLEERFIENADATSFRARNMFRVQHPVSPDRRWFAVAYDEFFFHLNSVSGGPVSGFDQNRAFLGVARQAGKELRVETGYMLVHVNALDGVPDKRLNIWLVQLHWNL